MSTTWRTDGERLAAGHGAFAEAMTRFTDTLSPLHVYPLWLQQGLLLRGPISKAIPYVWPFAPIRERLLEAGRIITAEQAERRVLILRNPGLGGQPLATQRLYAGLQLVMPGEIAPAHYHAASALRFVVEGSGAYTTVDGERAVMRPGDLVLTPSWAVHDHGNESKEPMIWLDGLDLPIVNMLDCAFFADVPEKKQALVRPDDASERAYAHSQLRPAAVQWTKNHSPVLKYPWAETERLLRDAWRDGVSRSAFDGTYFEYSNPFTGGSVLPTIACYAQLLAPGEHTAAHRHTTSAVYHVVKGQGRTIVNGESISWAERDTLAVPGWAIHEHVNTSPTEPAFLFSFTDDPTLKALGLRREQQEPSQEKA